VCHGGTLRRVARMIGVNRLSRKFRFCIGHGATPVTYVKAISQQLTGLLIHTERPNFHCSQSLTRFPSFECSWVRRAMQAARQYPTAA